MVTLIIDKLKNQSLEDLPSEEKVTVTTRMYFLIAFRGLLVDVPERST